MKVFIYLRKVFDLSLDNIRDLFTTIMRKCKLKKPHMLKLFRKYGHTEFFCYREFELDHYNGVPCGLNLLYSRQSRKYVIHIIFLNIRFMKSFYV